MFSALILSLSLTHAVDLNRRQMLATGAASAAAAVLPLTPVASPLASDLAYRESVWRLNGQRLFAEIFAATPDFVNKLPGLFARLERDMALRFGRAAEDVWHEMDDVLMAWRMIDLGRMQNISEYGLESSSRPARAPRDFYGAMLDAFERIHPDLRHGFGYAYEFAFLGGRTAGPTTRVTYWSHHNTILHLFVGDAGLDLPEAIERQAELAVRLVEVEERLAADFKVPHARVIEALAFWQHPRQEFPWEPDGARRPRRFPVPPPGFLTEYLGRVRVVAPGWADRLAEHYARETLDPARRYLISSQINRAMLRALEDDVRRNFPELLGTDLDPLPEARRMVEENEARAPKELEYLRAQAAALREMRTSRRRRPAEDSIAEVCAHALGSARTAEPAAPAWAVRLAPQSFAKLMTWPALPPPSVRADLNPIIHPAGLTHRETPRRLAPHARDQILVPLGD